MEHSGSNFVDCTLKLGLPDTSASKSDPRPATKKMRTEILQGSPSEEIKQITEVKQCTFCGTTVTPCWRTGPEGKKTLCNKCGLKFQRKKMLY